MAPQRLGSFSPAGVGVSGSASRVLFTVTLAARAKFRRPPDHRPQLPLDLGDVSSGTMRRSSRQTFRSGTTSA